MIDHVVAGEEAEEKPAVQGVPGPCGVGGPLLVALRQERESESDHRAGRPPPSYSRGDGDREDASGVYVSLLGVPDSTDGCESNFYWPWRAS